jgi:hypothetical protein
VPWKRLEVGRDAAFGQGLSSTTLMSGPAVFHYFRFYQRYENASF